jgi:hypothetical protein
MRPTGHKDQQPRTRGWTGDQVALLMSSYYAITDFQLSDLLKKSVRQIRKKARELGMQPKIRKPYHK